MMDFCQKGRKLENDGVDIISSLPDSILGKILSFVPTKDAVATSILSTRWKTLSPLSIPPIKLDLDDSSLLNYWGKSYDRLDTFLGFVDKLFNSTLHNAPSIEIMKLHCEKYFGDEKITSWVCAALRLKVRELLLEVSLNQSEALFGSLNGCTTLTRLELGKGFTVRVPDGFTLPNLKMLLLYQLKFHWDDGDMFGKLICGSPELEDLCLSDCKFKSWEEAIHIHSSALKKFTVNRCWMDIELDVPNLEVLQYSDCIPARIRSSVRSLIAAHIGAGLSIKEIDGLDEDDDEEDPSYARDVAVLVSACSSTVHLYLASCSIHALQRSREQLPTFQNLTSLALGCLLRTEGWALLARLLLLTPNLEKLTFEEGFSEHEGGYSGFESLLPDPPICLELHLREIKFEVFKEEEDELKLVEYFLRNGKVIQKLKVHCLPFKETKTSRLRMLPKHSKIDFQPR